MMPRYRLLAIDLDGTLVGNSPEISPRSLASIKAAARQGVTVTLATGRMFASTRPYAELLDIKAPIICYQGAQLRDPVSGTVIEETPVAKDAAKEVIAYCKERGYHVNAFLNDEVYMSELTDAGRLYTERANVAPQVVGDLESWLKSDVLKLVIVTDPKTTETIVRELGTRFDGRLYVTRSYPNYTETINANVSKGKALIKLAGRLGVPMREVMAIGDDLNDVEMVAAAGLGVAMGNGAAEVKAKAAHVTGTIDEDGVAMAVERFLLGKVGA